MPQFPVTAKDDPLPSDPKAEPTRAELANRPESLAERIERTRRYFRLVRKASRLTYARGLDTHPDEMA